MRQGVFRFVCALIGLAGVLAVASSLAADSATETSREISPPARADRTTQVQMRNVDYFVDRDIALRIRRLRGTMRSKLGGPVIFDDKSSFIIHIEAAEVGLTAND